MAKTRYVQVRANQDQFERIKNNASAKGYKTTAAYIRDLALEKNLVFERQFNELQKEIFAISKKISQKNSS